MLSDGEKKKAKKLYKHYAFRTKGEHINITPESTRAERAAYVMLGISRHFREEMFDQILDSISADIPYAGDPENRRNRREHQLIRTLMPLRPTSQAVSWTPGRNASNEPEDDDAGSIQRTLSDTDWTPANTNSQNYVWLNKVATLFELPGATKPEDVSLILRLKQIQDQSRNLPEEQKSKFGFLDYAQMGLDAAGFFEPTPFADAANATISLLRSVAEPRQAGSHLMNAGISLASTLPYIGDYAKLYKSYGRNDASIVDLLGSQANNRSRLGRISGMLFNAMGGQTFTGRRNSYGGQLPPTFNLNGLSRLQQGMSTSGAISNTFGAGLGAASTGSAATATGGSASAAGMLAGVFARLSAVAGLVVTGFIAITNWAEKTVQKGREMLESQRPGAMWSAQASNAILEYDFGRIRREGERGRYLAPSTAFLAQSQNYAESSSEEYFAPYVRASTNLQGGLNYVAGAIFKGVQAIDVVRSLLQTIFDLYPENKKAAANPIDAYQQMPSPIPTKPKKFNVV